MPQKCPSSMCGKVGDGCGGTMDCRPASARHRHVRPVCAASPATVAVEPLTAAPVARHKPVPPVSAARYPDGCGGTIDCGPCCVPDLCHGMCGQSRTVAVEPSTAAPVASRGPARTTAPPIPSPETGHAVQRTTTRSTRSRVKSLTVARAHSIASVRSGNLFEGTRFFARSSLRSIGYRGVSPPM